MNLEVTLHGVVTHDRPCFQCLSLNILLLVTLAGNEREMLIIFRTLCITGRVAVLRVSAGTFRDADSAALLEH